MAHTRIFNRNILPRCDSLACSFGTFYFARGEWRWIVDPTFTLCVPQGSKSRWPR